jgi:hypothetical protein
LVFNMALTLGTAHKPHSLGNLTVQEVDFTVATADTAATLTAPALSKIYHVLDGSNVLSYTAAPTYSQNTTTLAFTVPTATAATLTKGGVTYTSVALTQGANLISVAYTAGGTAGAEVVTVVDNAISVQIESGVSTITQVRTAVNASTPAASLVTATGTSGTAVTTAGASLLTGGITGGGAGTLLFIGV